MQPIIENMPIPPLKRKGAKPKYPWNDMQPGDAFKFNPEATMAGAASLSYATGRTKGMKFAVRLVDGEIWCWRVDGTKYENQNGNERPNADLVSDYAATAKPAQETVLIGDKIVDSPDVL